MKHLIYLLPIIVLFAISCQPAKEEHHSSDGKNWSKTMIYSIDQDKTFFEDQEDEDFSEFSTMFYEVIQSVYDGKLRAYEYWTGDPITVDSVKKMLNVIDSVYTPSDDQSTMAPKMVVINYEKDLPSIKVKEKWFWNKADLRIEKRVIAIAPRIPVYSRQTGELRGYSPLFWIFLDKEEEALYVEENKKNS